jgi:hypothetical protein
LGILKFQVFLGYDEISGAFLGVLHFRYILGYAFQNLGIFRGHFDICGIFWG